MKKVDLEKFYFLVDNYCYNKDVQKFVKELLEFLNTIDFTESDVD